MSQNRVLEILHECGAILHGHFQLVSKVHSPHYFQIGRLFQRPEFTVEIAELLCDPYRDQNIEVVIGIEPAGSVLAFEVGRLLGKPVIIGRRDGSAVRMFGQFPAEGPISVLIVDDVITTGGTICSMSQWIEHGGGVVAGLAIVLSKGLSGKGFPIEPRFLLNMLRFLYFPPRNVLYVRQMCRSIPFE